MDMEPVSTIFGIKITNIIAGILGGSVRAFLVGGNWFQYFISVFTGGVTAAYFSTPLTYSPINYWQLPEGTVGFLVGLTGMLLCEGIMRYARSWSRNPSLPGGKP